MIAKRRTLIIVAFNVLIQHPSKDLGWHGASTCSVMSTQLWSPKMTLGGNTESDCQVAYHH